MQDASLQESMGPVQDRTRENLVGTDNGIIMMRSRIMKSARALVEHGTLPPGLAVPEIEFTALQDQQKLKLSSLRGKVLVLNFWATWCGPCVAEFPEFVALDAKYRDKGVKFVGVTADDPEDVQPKVIPFIKKHQVKFDIVQQNIEDSEAVMNQITKDWNGVIPVTVVYDKQGNLAYSRFGMIDRDLLVAEIEKALK